MKQTQTNTAEQQSPSMLYMDTSSIKVGLFEITVPSIEEMADKPLLELSLKIDFLTSNKHRDFQHTGVLHMSKERFAGLNPHEFINECVYEMLEITGFGELTRSLYLVAETVGTEVAKIRWVMAKSSKSIDKFENEIEAFMGGDRDPSKSELLEFVYGVF